MREDMRERLTTELTRKQFLQYSAGALLMVFGLNNLISLLSGHKPGHTILVHPDQGDGRHGFGSSKFGV